MRAPRVCARCYDHAVKKWLVLGIVVVAAGVAITLYVTRAGTTHAPDAAVDDFRATERQCIAAFNAALREQRANAIDEVELANRIERDALAPWRAMAARVAAALVRDQELAATMRRYIAARQEAWEAYVAALRAAEADARPAYDRYHARNADADREARSLGAMFRRF
jgi:hypothetical protein